MPDKVLIDTSVWVDFFKFGKSKNTIISFVNANQAVYCGLIATELVRGAKGQEELDTLENLFEALTFVEETSETFHRAGQLGYGLARKGISLSTVDLVLAQVCLDNDLNIFSFDQHFTQIAKRTRLKVLS
jgi:hypothetical protein